MCGGPGSGARRGPEIVIHNAPSCGIGDPSRAAMSPLQPTSLSNPVRRHFSVRHRFRRVWSGLWGGFVIGFATIVTGAPGGGHPRLWVRPDDLPRLRSWAVPGNPIYQEGLRVRAEEAVQDVDGPNPPVPRLDEGSREPEEYATEKYAELFAFMSLIHPDAAARDDYARRATNLLMFVMNQAALGAAENVPFRDPAFYAQDSNRGRAMGEGWPLTVDWVYPRLSAADKATIRKVFLRWADELVNTGYHHPEPVGVTNDPALLADRSQVRWAGNNHFDGNLRNLAYLALVFDPEDDPGNQLRDYLGNALGAGLYLVDELLRTDARGGLFPEGPEYSPQALGYVTQLLFGLHTAGADDAARWGRQVTFAGNPFWDDVLPAFVHSLSPGTWIHPNWDFLGPVHQPAWYGDAQDYFMLDHMSVFGPLGLYAARTGNIALAQACRWVQTHLAPGGAAGLTERARDSNLTSPDIFYFLLFDPAAPAASDPRPALPLTHFAPGLGRVLARTGWGEDATWLTYKLSWMAIDHQNADGNQFEFYRRGEWLTKERSGYDLFAGSTDEHNAVTVLNDDPGREPDDFRELEWARGSQFRYLSAGDPAVLAHSFTDRFLHVLGDATPLHNFSNGDLHVTNVTHVSRSLLWLKPDHLILYDRAATHSASRFKRFFVNLPTNAVVAGRRTTMTTASGQQFFITTLLPADAVPVVEPAPVPRATGEDGTIANGDPMTHRLRVEAPGPPLAARFLHVLQGADPGAAATTVTLVESVDGTAFAGAAVGTTVAMFPVDLSTAFAGTSYRSPAGAILHLITGLTPGAGYTVTRQPAGPVETIAVMPGGPLTADSGGVLVFAPAGVGPLVLTAERLADGQVRLRVTGAGERAVSLQMSGNLATWAPLGQPAPDGGGGLELVDASAPAANARFYRAVVP